MTSVGTNRAGRYYFAIPLAPAISLRTPSQFVLTDADIGSESSDRVGSSQNPGCGSGEGAT
jgi:hypothetical protein